MVILGSEDGMGWKLGWWRREPGRLEMEGRRLDGPAPPAEPGVPDGYGDLGFQASGIGFPTEGCWEVVGRLGDDELRFVVRVVRGAAEPKEALERFMEARLAGDEQLALGLLARDLARDLREGSVQILLTALSNPCWYRYEIDSLARPSGVRAVGRVRVFEHWWPGDSAGEIPHSWAQEIGLEENAFSGWLVTTVGEPHDRRPEAGEPHGPNISACRQAGSG